VVTVALGSTLATILLSRDVALAERLLAFTLLITLQYIIACLSVRSRTVSTLVKAEPTLLLYRGEFLREALRRERVTEAAMRAAVRGRGIAGSRRWYWRPMAASPWCAARPETKPGAPRSRGSGASMRRMDSGRQGADSRCRDH